MIPHCHARGVEKNVAIAEKTGIAGDRYKSASTLRSIFLQARMTSKEV